MEKLQRNPINYHASASKILSSDDIVQTANYLKNLIDYDTLCKVSDALSGTVKPLNFALFGNSLPRKLEDLGKSAALYKPKTLHGELNWLLISIRRHAKQIDLFLLLKKDFEHFFLFGNYTKAESILDSILKETGYSLWYIEAKFLLLEYQNKSEEQKEFLSEINEANKLGKIGTLSHFLSFRTERNLSAYKYDADIRSMFRITKSKQEKDIKEYYMFRLNFFENYALQDYSHIILFETSNSVIDRYLTLRDVLKAASLKPENAHWVNSKARYLQRKVNDETITPILVSMNSSLATNSYFNESYIRILDLYYSGFFEDAIVEIRRFLKNEIIFDLLIILSYCLINLKIEYTKISDEPKSLLDQIGQKVFNLISNAIDRRGMLYSLYQINKNLLSFNIACGIDCFLKEEQNIMLNKNLKYLSLCYFDSYFANIFKNEEQALEYLEFGTNNFPTSISIESRRNFLIGNMPDETGLSEHTFLINKAKLAFKHKRYDDSIVEWRNISLKFPDNAPIIQTTLKFWFQCLVNLGEFNQAIEFYVNHYLKVSNSINKIDSEEILTILRKTRYKNIRRTINLPIFVALASNDDIEKSFILEQYCKIFNKKKPSELFEEKLDESAEKIEMFYNFVCGIDVLKHSIHINTTTERLSERLNIINYLIDITNNNNEIYIEELNIISNELIIYEGMQKLEDSKIYANDQAIINHELNEIEGLFNRYRTIYKLSLKDKKLLIISEKSFAIYRLNGTDKYEETEVKYTNSALAEVFAELFDSILEKYLFSKFGIVAYLSTRIRHGVLLGEIRPEIEKRNLILNTIGETGIYEDSKYWSSQRYRLNSSQQNKLKDILSKFSLKVDTLISTIIKEKIQIKKDGKNPKGLFNYEFDKQEMLLFATSLASEVDTKTFCQKVIDIIWERTDANLEVIRDYIDNEIKDRFSEELNSLEIELRNFFDNSKLSEIFTSINECNTIIENKLSKISSWFRRSGSTIDDFDMEKLINVVWKNTGRCYPKIGAKIKMTQLFNPLIKSSLYIHFTDLFRIFIDNMFKYGLVNSNSEYNFEFICKNDKETLICDFINIKKPGIASLPFKNQDGKVLVDTTKLIEEGNSGISKAIKIVKFDLGNEENDIIIITDEPTIFHVRISIDLNKVLVNEKNSDS